MNQIDVLEPEFVEEIPRELAPGKLYISVLYGAVVHLCCCGCRSEVVTPLHPTRWALTYDGKTVSLHPSVGSWGLPCKSHYVIRKNEVRWAALWSKDKIEAGRAREHSSSETYFSRAGAPVEQSVIEEPDPARTLRCLWHRLMRR